MAWPSLSVAQLLFFSSNEHQNCIVLSNYHSKTILNNHLVEFVSYKPDAVTIRISMSFPANQPLFTRTYSRICFATLNHPSMHTHAHIYNYMYDIAFQFETDSTHLKQLNDQNRIYNMHLGAMEHGTTSQHKACVYLQKEKRIALSTSSLRCKV